jgi:DNA polymerase I
VRIRYGTSDSPREVWQDAVASHPPVIAIDTEVPSLKDRTLLGVGLAMSRDEAFYITPDDEWFPDALAMLRDPQVRKIYHNAPFDLGVLRQYGVDSENVDDTALMCRLSGESAVLEEASFWVSRQTEKASDFLARYKVKTMDRAPIMAVAQKCCEDAQATFALYDRHAKKISMSYYSMLRSLIPILEKMSSRGIAIDQERRGELDVLYSREYQYLRTWAEGLGFNPGSPYQVGYMLALRGNFLPLSKTRKQFVTDEVQLRKLRDPVAGVILYYRHVQKMLSTYIRPLAGHKRAYTTLNMEAATGRVNSSGHNQPGHLNLQNIPKKSERGDMPTIRSMFLPDSGMITLADASQIELRVLAKMSGDERMMSVFDSGGDLHEDTARGVGASRDLAKTFNYALVFNAVIETISENTGIPVDVVTHIADRWAETYPQAWAWIQEQQEEGLRCGYVESRMGRKMWLPADQGEKHMRNCAVNYPVQSSAFEIFAQILIAMRGYGVFPHMMLQIHDEEMLDGDVELPWEELADVTDIHVPLEVQKKERWG